MRRITLSVILFLVFCSAYSQQAVPTDSLLGFFRLDGGAKEANAKTKAPKSQGITPAADRAGNAGKAAGLSYDFKSGKRSFISIPIEISPNKHALLTITFWIRLNSSNNISGIVYNSDADWSNDKYYRGLFTEREDGLVRWKACCGSDGSLTGPEVLAKSWTFIALVYDRDDQAMRMVVNDQVFGSAAKMRDNVDRLRIGPFDGQIDELRIYSRVLSLSELEALYGKSITKDTAGYAIMKRADYRAKMAKDEREKIKINSTYVVSEQKFPVHDSAGSHNVIAALAKDDTFRVLKVEKKSVLLLMPDGKEGYVSVSAVNDDAYPKGSSYILHELRVIFQSIFNFTNVRSWVIAVIFAVLLYFVIKKYDFIDRGLNSLAKRDPMAQGGSKSEGGSAGSIFSKVFPLKRMRWWPITIGAALALVVFIALIWNGGEVEWFFNDGFRLIPAGYTRAIHWFLYISFMTLMFMYIVMIIESFVVVGPIMAVPRIILLTILILMAILVTYYLSVLIAIIAVIMLVMFMLSAAASGTNYKCPHCSRTFSASPGSSVSCPHCGGGVRT